MKLRSYIALFCLFTFVIGIAFMTTSCLKKSSEKGESIAPAFQGKNLVDGEDISLEDLKGHVLIINFWATWCPPCRKEIPGFVELYSKYKDQKFAVIGMSLDRGNKTAVEAKIKDFIAKYKVNYPVIMAVGQIQKDYEKAMGKPVRSIPTTLVVNRAGEIVSVHVGYRPKKVFEDEIKKLLG